MTFCLLTYFVAICIAFAGARSGLRTFVAHQTVRPLCTRYPTPVVLSVAVPTATSRAWRKTERGSKQINNRLEFLTQRTIQWDTHILAVELRGSRLRNRILVRLRSNDRAGLGIRLLASPTGKYFAYYASTHPWRNPTWSIVATNGSFARSIPQRRGGWTLGSPIWQNDHRLIFLETLHDPDWMKVTQRGVTAFDVKSWRFSKRQLLGVDSTSDVYAEYYTRYSPDILRQARRLSEFARFKSWGVLDCLRMLTPSHIVSPIGPGEDLGAECAALSPDGAVLVHAKYDYSQRRWRLDAYNSTTAGARVITLSPDVQLRSLSVVDSRTVLFAVRRYDGLRGVGSDSLERHPSRYDGRVMIWRYLQETPVTVCEGTDAVYLQRGTEHNERLAGIGQRKFRKP